MFDMLQDACTPEQLELMRAAFEAAWQFLQADTVLGAVAEPERRAALAQAIVAVAAQGESQVVRLANTAIGRVRSHFARRWR